MKINAFLLPLTAAAMMTTALTSEAQTPRLSTRRSESIKRKIALATGSENYSSVLTAALSSRRHLTMVTNRSQARYQIKVRKLQGATRFSLYCCKMHRYLHRVTVRHPRSLQASPVATHRALTLLTASVDNAGTKSDEVNDDQNNQIPDDVNSNDPNSSDPNSGSEAQGNSGTGTTDTTGGSGTEGSTQSNGNGVGVGQNSGENADGEETEGSGAGGAQQGGTEAAVGKVRLRIADICGLRGDRVPLQVTARDGANHLLANTSLLIKITWPNAHGPVRVSRSVTTDAHGVVQLSYVIPRLGSADNIFVHASVTGASGEVKRRIRIGVRR